MKQQIRVKIYSKAIQKGRSAVGVKDMWVKTPEKDPFFIPRVCAMPTSVRLFVFASIVLFSWIGALEAQAADRNYDKGKALMLRLDKDPKRFKYRDRWLKVIAAFDDVHRRSSMWCPAQYNIGVLYQRLSSVSYSDKDRSQSVEAFDRVVKHCPSSSLADDSALLAATVEMERGHKDEARNRAYQALHAYPKGDMRGQLKDLLDRLGGTPEGSPPPPETLKEAVREVALKDAIDQVLTTLEGEEKTEPEQKPQPKFEIGKNETLIKPTDTGHTIRSVTHGHSDGKTSITVHFDSFPPFTRGELKATATKSRRVYFDFSDTGVSEGIDTHRLLPAGYVEAIRIGQDPKGQTRIVFDVRKDAGEMEWNTSLRPPRVNLSFSGVRHKTEQDNRPRVAQSSKMGYRFETVVIDPGHGGKDMGAVGRGGLREKDVVLKIAITLRKELKKRFPGLKIYMTRERDKWLTLKDRSDLANRVNADLFISIHNNAVTARRFQGLETFYLDNSADRYSVRLANRENRDAGYQVDNLEFILADLMTAANVSESIELAKRVQTSMIGELRKKYRNIEDRGVRKALFFVLLNVRMPAILVEASFISNPLEEKRLGTPSYRRDVAHSIAEGVEEYVNYMKSRHSAQVY